MAAALAPRFLRMLCLCCVLIVVAFSRHRIDALEKSMIKLLGKKSDDPPSQNASTSPTMKSPPDYMLRLLHRVTNPDGEQVHAGVVRGNLVYGFTENG